MRLLAARLKAARAWRLGLLVGLGLLWLSAGCNFPYPTPLPLPTPLKMPPGVPPSGGGQGAGQALPPTASGAVGAPGTPSPYPTLSPATPGAGATSPVNAAPFLYFTQAGDTLPVVAVHFGVTPQEIQSQQPLPERGLLNPNLLLVIPRRLYNTTSDVRLMPDSEVVYSPAALDFDVADFVAAHPGYLQGYTEFLHSSGTTRGVEILSRIALDNSINPRLLLAILEYQGHWLTRSGEELTATERLYPLGYRDGSYRRLYRQLSWAVNQLSIGYYGWREGWLTEVTFTDGVTARLAPELNAGTVALQYFFAQLYPSTQWIQVLDPQQGFMALYRDLFGDPWARAYQVEPLYPPDLEQPPLVLPFPLGERWAFTGGPHGAWERDGARAALDFAPSDTRDCQISHHWAVAAAGGLVVRSADGVVMIDLDGDGHEQTGWNLLYLHLAAEGRVPAGTWVEAGEPIGHPSCEGGIATGTHIHVARKYNGEWIAADGPLPFVLSGWRAHAGVRPYEGTLTKGERVVRASPYGNPQSLITRDDDGP